MANTEVERHTGVDVEDVPSANWGWSKQNHRAIQIGGILAGFFMLRCCAATTSATSRTSSYLLRRW